MDYISVKEASKKWKIDTSRIGLLAREGRIKGAIIVGRNWLIPSNAEKPIDLRKTRTNTKEEVDYFRFPIFVGLPKDKFNPPLSSDELSLRTAQIHFYKCNFDQAEKILIKLCDSCENIYVKICSLFFMCILIAAYNTKLSWDEYYRKFISCLDEDYKNKMEMQLLKPLLDTYLGLYNSAGKKLSIKYKYKYHESSYCIYSYLSFFHLIDPNSIELDLKNFEIYEVLCQEMENSGHILEAQSLHRMLFVSYLLLQNNDQMMYHLGQVISIAKQYDLLYIAAEFEPYYQEYYSIILKQYPDEFIEKIHQHGKAIYDNFALFNKKFGLSKLYSELSERDYQIVLYKLQGYLNKQIAIKMNISERTVANRLSTVYEKLGIKNKSELVSILQNSL